MTLTPTSMLLAAGRREALAQGEKRWAPLETNPSSQGSAQHRAAAPLQWRGPARAPGDGRE